MGSASGKTNSNKTMKASGYRRRAHHAGSWYSSDPESLDETLSKFLTSAAEEDAGKDDSQTSSSLRGIICPHAGYSYSGPTAAFSYRQLQEELSKPDSPIQHILVFHPSHHYYLDGCAVSGAQVIETPLGDLTVDEGLRDEILKLQQATGNINTAFTTMDRTVDEAEHSGEMQYPYIAKAQLEAAKAKSNGKGSIDRPTIPILPIMCGNISTAKEEEYGRLLAPIVARPDVLSVISTDFCHWGKRFGYQPKPNSSNNNNDNTDTTGRTTSMEIFEHIQNLDREGMRHIEMQEPGAFATYLKATTNRVSGCFQIRGEGATNRVSGCFQIRGAFATYLKATRNTICGRHAVQVWLNAVHSNCHDSKREVLDISFVKYDQSSSVRSMTDSSVSYASATARTRV